MAIIIDRSDGRRSKNQHLHNLSPQIDGVETVVVLRRVNS
jgi:hypothetical protein